MRTLIQGHIPVPEDSESSTNDDSTFSDSDESDSSLSEETGRDVPHHQPTQHQSSDPRPTTGRPKQPCRRGTRVRKAPDRLQVSQMVNGFYEFSFQRVWSLSCNRISLEVIYTKVPE